MRKMKIKNRDMQKKELDMKTIKTWKVKERPLLVREVWSDVVESVCLFRGYE
jgi:hypothetical protein